MYMLSDVTIIEFAHDLADVTDFYRDVLGLPVKAYDPAFAEFYLAQERGDGLVLRIEKTDDRSKRGKLSWRVPNLDRWIEKLKTAKVAFRVEDDEGHRVLRFSDPHGNEIELREAA